MKSLTAVLIGGSLLAAAGAGLVATSGAASATGTAPPWVATNPDPNGVGGLAFFASDGSQITSGPTNSAPFAKYVAGLTQLRANDTTATIYAYVPTPGTKQESFSSNEQVGGSPSYPNTSAPEPIKSTSLPVYTGDPGDFKLTDIESDYPNSSSDANYDHVYEIRLYTGAAGKGGTTNYDYADIKLDDTAHTWSLVYTPDAQGTATTSTLTTSADPSDSVTDGTSVTLSDTVAPYTGSGTPKGTVQFKDGSTAIGSPVTLNSSGVATTTALISGVGSHPITAVYSPAGLSGFAGSTSNTKTITATTAPATNTSVALVANPTSGPAFAPVQLTATITPSAAAGTVTFFDAGQQIGSPQTVSGGSASITYSGFTQGDHPSITASFTPTNTAAYNPSVSPAVDYNAGAPVGATPDPQPIQVTVPPGTIAITTPYTTAHPLNLGNMVLNANGTELSATAQFGQNGYASRPTGSQPDGTGSIQVVDTRVGGANWTASASSSDLTDGHSHSINSQNVGLTSLNGVYLPGNALQQGSLAFTDNPAAEPAVAPTATGTQGLGGGTAHAFATTTHGGAGSVGIYGTLTLHAPTSTSPGAYSGIITFTVA
ncbi:Ig-like domain-containing protein [uncultured Jatrophihabitans sp.]|uniref:Ig-like domain-containing protein n=1 Tax=uncultured Jatrophihabitans sp. TaxID=1610747 RepID=UPI0035CBA31A